MLGFLWYLVVFVLINNCVIETKETEATTEEIETAFLDAKIVPDLISKAPLTLATVKYSSYHKLGSEVVQSLETEVQPTVCWEAQPDMKYTLVMIDPDAPSRSNPELAEIQHWLVVNILGNKLEDGEVLSTYLAPNPSPVGGSHRYIFLVYEQDGELEFDEPRVSGVTTDERAFFSVRDFANKYGLGEPVAGNFILVESVEICSIL